MLQTSAGVEGAKGSNELRKFFDFNDKLKIEWYNKLIEQDIDYDDLIESDEGGLKSLLKDDCKLKSKAVTRIVNAVRKVPDSVLYKLLHGTKVSVVSAEEHEAAKKLQIESARIAKAITNMTNIMERLTANSQNSEQIINDVFDNIINVTNERRNTLLLQLKDVTNSKYNLLSDQKNTFTEKIQILNEAYNETQQMMKDTTMDIVKRKTKITTKSKVLLSKKIRVDPVTNDQIKILLEPNDIHDMISKVGLVVDGNVVLPPEVEIKAVAADAAIVTITANENEKECIGHKLEYTKYEDENEEKLDWTSIDVE